MAAAVEDDAEGLGRIPPDYVCPITQELMREPVIAMDGHSYEKDAILQWFARGTTKSPLTNAVLGSRHVTPNHTLRKAIDNFLENEMPHLRDQQNQLDNLEAAIKMREADLMDQPSKATVPKEEYDRVVALLARTQQDLLRHPPPVLPPPPVPAAEPTDDDRELMKWARQNPNATEVRRIGKKITDVGAQALARACPNLTKIWLENTQVTDVGAQALAHACPNLTTYLTEIGLGGTQVTDVGAQALANACPNLTKIGLSNTQVTDVGAQALAHACPNLTKIWLENTQVTDAGAQAFAHECPNLTWIDLSGTQVTISVWVYLWPMWATGLSFVI